jgi:hypothetical protein
MQLIYSLQFAGLANSHAAPPLQLAGHSKTIVKSALAGSWSWRVCAGCGDGVASAMVWVTVMPWARERSRAAWRMPRIVKREIGSKDFRGRRAGMVDCC